MRYDRSSSVIQTVTKTEANTVLRKTYLLLSITLLFSALMAMWAMHLNARPSFILMLIAVIAIPMVAIKFKDSIWGLVATFAYTGLLGFFIGPLVNSVIHGFSNGSQIVATAFGGTAAIFFGLTAYSLISKKNFSYLAGTLSIGILIAFMAGIGAAIFHMPMLQLIISGAFTLLSAGYILYMTSSIINGGETSYIVATITLFASIMNIFISFLNILTAFGGSRN